MARGYEEGAVRPRADEGLLARHARTSERLDLLCARMRDRNDPEDLEHVQLGGPGLERPERAAHGLDERWVDRFGDEIALVEGVLEDPGGAVLMIDAREEREQGFVKPLLLVVACVDALDV